MSQPNALAALEAALLGTSLPPRNVATGMNVGIVLSAAQKNDVAAYIAGLAAPAPVVTYSPAGGPQFPATAVGSTSSQTATITNTGTAPLVFATNNAVTIATGGDAADFRVTSSTCPGVTLQAGSGNCTINVTFQPTAGASTTRTASIGLSHNANGGSSLVPMLGIVGAGATTPPATTPPTGSANPPSSGGGG
ncbi:MAG: choice-of-anchor D domain-containing protein, partial [Burkholderiaceae bacterium]